MSARTLRHLTVCIWMAAVPLSAWPVDLIRRADESRADTSVDTVLGTARPAIAQRDWARALTTLNAALQDHPGNADVHNLLGYSYRMQSAANLPQALTHYREALRVDANHQGAHEYIGQAYLMLNRPEDAQRHLEALERLCGGRDCLPWRQLSAAITAYRRSGTAATTDGVRYPQ